MTINIAQYRNDPDYLDISIPVISGEIQLFIDVVNQGIDSRLEGFTKSIFTNDDNRHWLFFHVDELPILIRRLCELEDEDEEEEAGSWAVDIVESHYGVELY